MSESTIRELLVTAIGFGGVEMEALLQFPCACERSGHQHCCLPHTQSFRASKSRLLRQPVSPGHTRGRGEVGSCRGGRVDLHLQ